MDPGKPRSSKKNMMDRTLLASWAVLYGLLLLGFGILKRLERVKEQSRVPKSLGNKSS